jgi:signal transduction histidine kinase
MPKPVSFRLALASWLAAGLLTAIFAGLLIRSREGLRAEIHRKIIERDAAVLYPVASQQLSDVPLGPYDSPGGGMELTAVLRGAQLDGILAVAVFDAAGNPVRSVPATLLFVDLPVEDFLELTRLKPISRYHPEFSLDRTLAGLSPAQARAPVLEVLLPLQHGAEPKLVGVARYFIDARPLARELAQIDQQINRQSLRTIGVAAGLIGLVVAVAYFGLRRAHRQIAERNERLTRANFDLTLAVKASAIGQITAHLVHGLQGSVAGLHAVVTNRETGGAADDDWKTAAGYTQRMQALIQEAVALLGDADAQATFELTGHELAAIVRQRNEAVAAQKGVRFEVEGGFAHSLDSHRGGLLCLITNNLVQNAIEATGAAARVSVHFRNGGDTATVLVRDEGHGIPEALRPHLFEAGRSGRPGGTGLGLALSRLLARKIGATLQLDATGPAGTTFRVTLPLVPGGRPANE